MVGEARSILLAGAVTMSRNPVEPPNVDVIEHSLAEPPFDWRTSGRRCSRARVHLRSS